MKKKKQFGNGLPLAALLPAARLALPFLGRAALGGAASFGLSSVLIKILGGSKKDENVTEEKLNVI